MDLKFLHDNTDPASEFLSAMANAKRLLILCNLVEAEITVGALADKIGLSQSALSQHLSKLRAMDLVATRRDAQTIYYSCTDERVHEMLQTLNGIFEKGSCGKSAA
ncbi:metalloregulator ArsR/SmtB family transcription factor [Rhizobium sp. L1K21]|uniref:ArsR/SmtB family transcription factor n=1 Tax=Rhizobium sp. L1K21 TaxID=2954933 RepID=UPI0020924A34|nr:metalloregulator ArsR/SmtB family transcription factor [Rhizobium sp. L1K21]MCO6185378.1 metalloregulator ArsR/SmtB family transcription factor [Rhizobium sp. L1K21]